MSDPVSGAVVQNPPQSVEVGFVGGTITGYIRDNENADNTGDQEYVKDEDGNDSVCLTSNLGLRFQVDGTVAYGTVLPKKGQTVTIGSTKYNVEASSSRSTSKARRFSLTLYKPDATTWS